MLTGAVKEYTLYIVNKATTKFMHISVNDELPLLKNSVVQTVLYLDKHHTMSQREVYNFYDLLGDLGGIAEIVLLAFGYFLYPIAQHSFTMKATRKLFLART